MFQPIIELERGRIAGFEALARFDHGPAAAPNQWFAEAARCGLVAEFEAAVLSAQLARRSTLPGETFLSVNVEPESLLSDLVMDVFRSHAPLDGIVVEVTEHRGLGDPIRIRHAIDQLRSRGALIAVDDAGAGYSGLQQILILEPQILKLDRSLIAGIDTDQTKASLVEMLSVFASRIDATVLAEGIETEGEARACADLDVRLAQGFYFARPSPPWASISDSVVISLLGHTTDRGETETLRPLLSVNPSIEGNAASSCTGGVNTSTSTPLVVTRNARPIGLIPSAGGDMVTALIAHVNTKPAELANRIATASPERHSVPVMVVDDTGLYIGVVTIGRLLRYLAADRV